MGAGKFFRVSGRESCLFFGILFLGLGVFWALFTCVLWCVST